MTISTYSKSGPYTGTATAGQELSVGFEFFNTSEIVVTTRVTATGVEATLDETTDYTVSTVGSGPYTSGTVALVAALAATSTVTISRGVDRTQTLDLVTGGPLAAEGLEDRYDKLAMWLQELEEIIGRCLKLPITDGETLEATTELSSAVDRASTNLTFSSDGTPTASALNVSSTPVVTSFAETILDDANAGAVLTTLLVSSFMQTVLDDADAASARTTLAAVGVADILSYENDTLFYENEVLIV